MKFTPILRVMVILTAVSTLTHHASAQMSVAVPPWSPDPVTATQNIQSAIDGGADMVYLNTPPGGNAWVIRTVDLRSNQILQFAPGLVIQNDPDWTGQTNGDDIFRIYEIVDSQIWGSALDPARIEFTKPTQPTPGYQGHCVELQGSQDVVIRNLILTSHWGDGITMNGGGPGFATPCDDVTVTNCVSIDCARVGLTITNARNVVVQGCEFVRTGLTSAPGTFGPVGWGVDIEPDHDYQEVTGIRFTDCTSRENAVDGFRVWLRDLRPYSEDVDILFDGCDVVDNLGTAFTVNTQYQQPPTGTVTFDGCTATDVEGSGVFAVPGLVGPRSLRVVFDTCTWTDVATNVVPLIDAPFILGTTPWGIPYPQSGVDFYDCTLTDGLARPFAIINPGESYPPGVFFSDVEGDIEVINPNPEAVPPELVAALPNLVIS